MENELYIAVQVLTANTILGLKAGIRLFYEVRGDEAITLAKKIANDEPVIAKVKINNPLIAKAKMMEAGLIPKG